MTRYSLAITMAIVMLASLHAEVADQQRIVTLDSGLEDFGSKVPLQGFPDLVAYEDISFTDTIQYKDNELLPKSADLIAQNNTSSQNAANNSQNGYRPYYYDEDFRGGFVYGDWIYWKPFIGHRLSWADIDSSSVDLNTGVTYYEQNNIKSLVYHFSSGFRVGLGYRFDKNAMDHFVRPWQVDCMYTRLNTNVSGSASTFGIPANFGDSTNERELLRPLVPLLSGGFKQYTSGHSSLHLEYDRVDVKFAWPFWINNNVIIRPLIGATYAHFENSWKTQLNATDPTTLASGSTRNSFKWKYHGGGLLLGGDIYTEVGRGLGFFADTTFAMVAGPMSATQDYQVSIPDFAGGPNSIQELEYKNKFYNFQSVFNFGAGIDYKHWFKDTVMLYLSVGWEVTWWFDMNQFGEVSPCVPCRTRPIENLGDPIAQIGAIFDTDPTDLGFQGLTARVGLDF